MEEIYILFCENPVEPGRVDPDFEDEYQAGRQNGFRTILYNYEELTTGNPKATRTIPHSEKLTQVIYRGWMLTPQQYTCLYNDLLNKNLQLINTAQEYRYCHYLPDSLRFIGDASDTEALRQTINNLIRLRGDWLNEGIVVREFIELTGLTIHSKSGMPLTEEYRLFFCNKQLIDIYDYWEEGEYNGTKPDTREFEEIAGKIDSHFFSMDIARQKNGHWIIIELGDGQVAGLPDKTNRNEFYKRLKQLIFHPNS